MDWVPKDTSAQISDYTQSSISEAASRETNYHKGQYITSSVLLGIVQNNFPKF